MATLKLGVKLTVAVAVDRCYTLQTKKLKQEEDSVQEKRKAVFLPLPLRYSSQWQFRS